MWYAQEVLKLWPTFLLFFGMVGISYIQGRLDRWCPTPGLWRLKVGKSYWVVSETWQRQDGGGYFFYFINNDEEEVQPLRCRKQIPGHFIVHSKWGWRYLEPLPF